ncbi:hypothetical protein STEG23_030183 [Scotinomys teguina]
MKFAGKWIELENVILSEVTQTQKDKQALCCIRVVKMDIFALCLVWDIHIKLTYDRFHLGMYFRKRVHFALIGSSCKVDLTLLSGYCHCSWLPAEIIRGWLFQLSLEVPPPLMFPMTVTPLGRDQDCSLKNREPDVPAPWFLDPGGWSKTAAVRLYFIFPGICTLSLILQWGWDMMQPIRMLATQ